MKVLYILILFAFFASCDKTMPAGFWNNFHKSLLVKNLSDHGPYGGHREMYWKSDKAKVFISKEVIKFATNNSWSFVDSFFFSAKELINLTNNSQTFPFTYSDFADSSMNTTAFHKWITSDVMIYRFKTNWIAIEPGNSKQTENNGYIVINSDGSELSVYHLWGE
jgi:hypothetical protein